MSTNAPTARSACDIRPSVTWTSSSKRSVCRAIRLKSSISTQRSPERFRKSHLAYWPAGLSRFQPTPREQLQECTFGTGSPQDSIEDERGAAVIVRTRWAAAMLEHDGVVEDQFVKVLGCE